jgi:hypothetical protein
MVMIFPNLSVEKTLQVKDATRLDARKSIYRDIANVKDVEISPENDGLGDPQYVSVYESGDFQLWYLDYLYETDGEKEITLRITDIADVTKVTSETITVVTEESDALFSKDKDIVEAEPDVMRYLPEGKTSYLYAHRESQRRILAFLDENRIWKNDETRFTKDEIVDVEEFVHWSRFLTLHMIYTQKIVSIEDFFSFKADEYKGLMNSARGRATLRLDKNGDGVVDTKQDRLSTLVVRR